MRPGERRSAQAETRGMSGPENANSAAQGPVLLCAARQKGKFDVVLRIVHQSLFI